MSKFYFFLGLIIFYIILFLSPNKPIYFSAYFIATFFFYLATKNIRIGLLFSLILSLFSEVGIAASLFLMEPEGLALGSGWWISPMTLLILCLLPLSIVDRGIKKIHGADIFVLLFFLWSLIVFLFYPYTNVLYGIIALGEGVLTYYMLRSYISQNNIEYIFYLLVSMLAFQSVLGGLQFILRRPIGIVAEAVVFSHPFGLTAAEEESLFRISGTFGHPNFLASFILSILPLVLFYPRSNIFLRLLKILSIMTLFFTFSRAGWATFFIMGSFWILGIKKRPILRKFLDMGNISFFSFIILLLFLLPLIVSFFWGRIQTLSSTLEEGGSMNIRLKLIQEGLNILQQYPLTGVGLNRSLETYAISPLTNLFTLVRPSGFYRIHNTLVEIAAEMGMPGILLFISFIFLIVKDYLMRKKNYLKMGAFYGFLGLSGISLFNPFFHFFPLRIFFLLSTIILV